MRKPFGCFPGGISRRAIQGPPQALRDRRPDGGSRQAGDGSWRTTNGRASTPAAAASRTRRPGATIRRSPPTRASSSPTTRTRLTVGRARSDAAGGLRPPREDHAFRPRAHPRARRPRPRLGGARLFRADRVARRRDHGRHPHAGRRADAGVRALLDGRRQHRARPTCRATCAASPSSSTPRKATGISSATTSRCSSSRTRSSSPTSSTR